MHIYGPNHIHGPQPINPPHRDTATAASGSPDRVDCSDQLDISREADLASRIRDLPEIRADRVAQIRSEIAAGIYETHDKLEAAVGRLFDELAG